MGVSVHTFEDKNKIADEFSVKIKYYFKSKGVEVIDLESHPFYRKKDIDFIIKKDNKKKKVELKADTYYPNNFYIETISNTTKNTTGCFLYTESDFILYAFINHNIFYMIPTDKFQDWFKDNTERFPKPKNKIFTPVGGGGYYSEGRLVPVSVMVEELNLKPFTLE